MAGFERRTGIYVSYVIYSSNTGKYFEKIIWIINFI